MMCGSTLWRFLLAVVLLLAAGFKGQCGDLPARVKTAMAGISSEGILQHIKVLASDEFEGRAPGTVGEEKTVAYLVEQFKRLGLKPGNPDGAYVQEVPFIGIRSKASAFHRAGNAPTYWAVPDEAVLWSQRPVPEIKVLDSEMVFVGYGVVAPEYGWDDYKGMDARGKTLVFLIGDPPVPDPSDPSSLDEKLFKGRAMTYYGRWTYKFEIAARKGAQAAIIVHETAPAAYPWSVVVMSNTGEHFDLKNANDAVPPPPVEGWITVEQARRICSVSGQDYDALKQAAARKDFRPVPLPCRASFAVTNTMRDLGSRNVLARLDGSHRTLRNERVIFTAHWDHLGRDTNLTGDQVYNGALDNASGVAAMLEIARAFTQLQQAPRRTLLFVSVTAEEKGLLGSRYYATHPLYPVETTVANLNLEGTNPWGRTRNVEVIGRGNSTLEDSLEAAATRQGRVVVSESQPERGMFYRSDHFEFAKVGIPALYFKSGLDYIGKPKEFGKQKIDEFIARDYHRVTEEIRPDWDLSGAVEDARLMFDVGWNVAQERRRPEWKRGSEFKREAVTSGVTGK